MRYDDEGDGYDDAHRPGHPESSDDESWEYGYHGEDETIHYAYLSVCPIAFSLGDEECHDGRECDHTDIAHDDAEHRHYDEHPEPYIPHICPGLTREYEEHREGYRVEKERRDRWGEHHRPLPIVIDERPEPYPTEQIHHQIESSEHPRDEDWVRREVRPERDREPEQHIGKSCYSGVSEDVGKEVGFHVYLNDRIA